MFRVKVCGLRTSADISGLLTALLHAQAELSGEQPRLAKIPAIDAVGFNFWPGSKRFVEPTTAARLATELAAEVSASGLSPVQIVGLFVDARPQDVLAVRQLVPLDWLQLHGHEPATDLLELPADRVVKAFRMSVDGPGELTQFLVQAGELGAAPAGVLLDSFVPGQLGGTGALASREQLEQARQAAHGLPWILAGGLNAENVGSLISVHQPWGVDTAGGVEGADGQKSPERMLAFALAARRALAQLPSP